MSAKLDWAIIRCIDGRLNEAIEAYLEEMGVPTLHDVYSLPGGPKDLIDGDEGFIKTIDEIIVQLHGVTNIMLIQHTDCGAYGGRAKCGCTERRDLEFQLCQLRRAGHAMTQFPELKIHMAIAHILDNGQIKMITVTT